MRVDKHSESQNMNLAGKPAVSRKRGKKRDQGTLLVDRVEQFALLKRASREDLSSLKEFFYSLVNKADKEQRRRMSVALARNPYTPRSILLFLAMDEVDIASPILLFSQSLSENDIRSVIGKTAIEHGRVIARRDNLSLETIHVLLDRDDDNQTVLKILHKNASIAATVMTAITQRAEGKSASFPTDVSFTTSIAQTQPSTSANQPAKDLSDQLLKLANTGGRLKPDSRKKAIIAARNPSADELGKKLILSARAGHHVELAEQIFDASGLSPQFVQQYIDKSDVGTFACLLRVLDMTRTTAARILLLLFPRLGRDQNVFADVMMRYEGLEKPSLQAFFKTVDANFAFQGQHEKHISQAGMFSTLLRNRRNSILEMTEQSDGGHLEETKISA